MAARNSGRTQQWGGWRAQQLRTVILRRDDTCWLCGQPGSNSLDHVMPSALFPELRWDWRNLRPAHLHCNQSRGAHNSSQRRPPDWLAFLSEFGISESHPAVRQAPSGPRRHPIAAQTWADPWDDAPEPPVPASSRPKPTWAIV